MLKRFLGITLLTALLGVGSACTQVGTEGDISTPITAALKISFSEVAANTAEVSIVTDQEEVASILVSAATPKSSLAYIEMDAMTRRDWINANGTSAEVPYRTKLTGLAPSTSYVISAIGLDKDGKAITAPTFAEVKTGECSVAVALAFVDNGDGTVTFSGSITPNENTDHVDYIFNTKDSGKNNAELEALIKAKGADVKTVKIYTPLTIAKTTEIDAVLAAIPYDALGNAGAMAKTVVSASLEDKVAVNLPSDDIQLGKVADNIFEGTVDVPAGVKEFTISINSVPHGFIKYSGNGGIGIVNNAFSAAPFYNYAEGNDLYPSSKTIGRMDAIEKDAVPFWVNEDAAVKLLVRVDLNKEVPVYYIEKQVTPDPSVVLSQTFDLFVWGGNYADPIKGSGPGGAAISSSAVINYDGTEVAVPNSISSTSGGTDIFSYGEGILGTDLASAVYIANRDMVGWDIENICEMPGHIRIGKSSAGKQGWLLTPALKSLSAPTDVTLSFDCGRFGNNVGAVTIRVEGAGEFKKVVYNAANDGDKEAACSGNEFVIAPEVCPAYANSFVHKPWSHVVLSISGATDKTRIRFDATTEPSPGGARFRLDNILIKK